jgi:hypothetical protein
MLKTSLSIARPPVAAVALMIFAAGGAAAQTRAQNEGDLVSDWMAIAAAERVDWFARTPENARGDSVVALAMFEAANAVERRYPSYLGFEAPEADAPAELAAASAAAAALSRLYPDKQAVFEGALSAASGRAGEAERARAAELGQRAADAALARGRLMTEGAERRPYLTAAPAGVYVPTEAPTAIADFDLALAPWALASVDDARPPAPPALTSETYARSHDEVRTLGGKESAARTPEQTETAEFWFFIDLNPLLREIAERPGRTVSQNARLYAMYYMATDDAWIASADAKSHYQLWRPETAIRQADRDDNPDTDLDLRWSSLRPTPPHPEYPCAHCVQAAARAVVLAAELGDDADAEFEVASSTRPDAAPRSVTIEEYVEQTMASRIYAGAHYRFSNEAGRATGENVGRRVVERWAEGAR